MLSLSDTVYPVFSSYAPSLQRRDGWLCFVKAVGSEISNLKESAYKQRTTNDTANGSEISNRLKGFLPLAYKQSATNSIRML